MEQGQEVEEFKKKSVLVICWAGSDRSEYIADELNKRGYLAFQAGVMEGQNYVTQEDLSNVGTIVFSSLFEKREFDKDKRLAQYTKKNGIGIRVLNVTESDKDRAHSTGNTPALKGQIATQLDSVGLK